MRNDNALPYCAGWPEWPRSDDLRIDAGKLGRLTMALSSEELGCLVRALDYIGGQMVWTYTPPSDDPALPVDGLKYVFRMSTRRARKIMQRLGEFFEESGGKWRLKDPSWIDIAPRRKRNALPDELREFIRRRDGDRCTYCGDPTGPFHYDHIFPVSRGGLDEPGNLTLACIPCNLSKGSKTVMEWTRA